MLSGILNGWGLSAMGWGNAYYSAAVRSMGSSWHNFLYASFDSGGYVSVDKPPFSMWVQVVSSKLFGFSRFSLLLPEVLAGALAVWLLYWGLRRTWGRTAGLVGAAALALMPINIVVNHSNNTDSILALLMTAAAVAAIEAVRTGRLRWLFGGCVLAGCAMTTKMLAATPVMPGMLIAFAWCAPSRLRLRLRHAAMGVLVLAAAGLWWFAAVQLTATGSRPYVGSTQTNSVFELAFERNGVRQVEGDNPFGARTRPASAPPGAGQPGANAGANAGVDAGVDAGARRLRAEVYAPPLDAARAENRIATGPGNFAGLGFNGGDPGVGRLVNRALGAQVGWLIPLALIGAVGALISTRLRRSARLGALIVLGSWFAAGALVFSLTEGVVHPYYVAGIGPPIAGLAGIGVASFRFDYEARRLRKVLVGVAALILTAIAQWSIWIRFGWRSLFAPVMVGAVAAVVVAGAIRWRRRGRRATGLTIGAAAALLLLPAIWVQGSLAAGVSGALPYANPKPTGSTAPTGNDITPNGGFQFPSISVRSLVAYLRTQQDHERWIVAVPSAAPAEEIIITSGESVMAIGGFIGSDPIVAVGELERLVHDGKLRFFLLSASPSGVGLLGIFATVKTSWVSAACRAVDRSDWQKSAVNDTAKPGVRAFVGGPTAAVFELYDCKGAV